MTSLPSPLLIWSLALAALALGLGARRRERGHGSSRLPAVVRIGMAVPAPGWIVERTGGRRVTSALSAAGLVPALTVESIARSSAGLAVLGTCAAIPAMLVHPAAVVVAAPLGGAGYWVPQRWLATQARRRRSCIVRELPDLIDLVVICVEAGMPLETAVRLAAARLPGPLADEFATTLRELDLGTPRREAYRALSQRVGAVELTSLVGALLQAQELGTPIAGVLSGQSDLLRVARKQAIREHAARTAPRVQLVVAMVMVPAALLVVLGVMVIHLFEQLGVVAGGIT